MTDPILSALDAWEDELNDALIRDAQIHAVVEKLIEKGEETPDDETPEEFYLRLYKMVAADLASWQPHQDFDDMSFYELSQSPLNLTNIRFTRKVQ